MNPLAVEKKPLLKHHALTSRPGRHLRVGLFFTVVCLSGCASLFDSQKLTPAPVVIAPIALPTVPTSLNAEATDTLKAAEQSVIEARVKRVLWSAAAEQLAEARKAAKIFDSEATLKHAKEAIVLCELSSKQAQLPPVAW